jgi:hypothetical protein
LLRAGESDGGRSHVMYFYVYSTLCQIRFTVFIVL